MSATARNQVFSAVHTVGALLPADMLVRISEGKDVSGSKPAEYRVIGARSVRDDAERHWSYLKSIWVELREKLPVAGEADVPADLIGLARGQWLEPLFNELGFGSLATVGAAGISSDDGSKTFAISHRWNHVPIHLIPWNAKLDTRPAPGTVPPQSLMQECLNRSDAHLWAVLSNGRQLRLLRDSNALATASYVEFDLEAIFDGELFSEFVLLYRLLHVSRFDVAAGAAPSTCWLEKWRLEAITSGTRALDHLRDGVQNAITTLGTGFLRHPANASLREDTDVQAFHNALLRLVYRMLFLFVAEDRDVLHPAGTDSEARERYEKYFSSARLRVHARRRRGTAHSDLYQALTLVQDALGDERGRPELGLPGLGGIFTGAPGDSADEPLRGLSLSNEYLLTAVRHLAQVRDAGTRRWRSVDYRNLGAEELGSIYESLLELVPKHSAVDRSFELVELAGNSRKTTGSYYTPSSLIECLLDSALDPVIDEAVKRGEQAAATAGRPDPSDAVITELLSLTVCDPACGSGHFLVAAARRIAKRVAAVREHNPEPTLDAVRHALHEVIAQCVYGVDLNPMAVELAKISLWLEGLEAGKPLSFLDAHLKQGNALIGATPALLRRGIPDEAFKPIGGDDKKYARGLTKQNHQQRANQGSLFGTSGGIQLSNTEFTERLAGITTAPANTLEQVRKQESAFREWEYSPNYLKARLLSDAWCAAFVWGKTQDAPPAVTQDVFRSLERPDEFVHVSSQTLDEIIRLRAQYSFFHWHLEFAEVFRISKDGDDVDEITGWTGGFDCILGNPPWDRIKLQELEFFAQRDLTIATAGSAVTRKRLIAALKENPDRRWLYAEFEAAKRKAEGESHFLRNGGRYPLTGRGDINTYAVFSESGRMLVAARGRMGVIVPTGIATDATTQFFFKDLVHHGSIAALFDFENRMSLFPAVDSRMNFAILSLTGRALREPSARFAFFLHQPADLAEPDKAFALAPEEITLLNPNTGTCPVFRSRRDAAIALAIYRRMPVIIQAGVPGGNPWGMSFSSMFHMSNDSHRFRERGDLESAGWSATGNRFTRDGTTMMPLYEGKMVHHFDHRWATYESGTVRDLTPAEKQDPKTAAMPRYWVAEDDVRSTVPGGVRWLTGFRNVCRNTDERSVISSAVPLSAVGNSMPMIRSSHPVGRSVPFFSVASSFIFDFVVRQKTAGPNLNFFILEQIPLPAPEQLAPHQDFVRPRVLELCYTADGMADFAADLGDLGPPFVWNEERRAAIRIELDALFFHLYGISHDEVNYIMDTFSIIKRKDEARYGTYQTKDLILVEYDRMAAACVNDSRIESGNYASTLNPPPGQGARHPLK